VAAAVDALAAAAARSDLIAMLGLLKELVSEYQPAYHFEGRAPFAFRQLRTNLFPKH